MIISAERFETVPGEEGEYNGSAAASGIGQFIIPLEGEVRMKKNTAANHPFLLTSSLFSPFASRVPLSLSLSLSLVSVYLPGCRS